MTWRIAEEVERRVAGRPGSSDDHQRDGLRVLFAEQDKREFENVDVVEIYSPPRVTAAASSWGLTPGGAMDLKTGWDFAREADKVKAREYVDRVKPALLIGSPECAKFSTLQRLSAQRKGVQQAEAVREAVRHMDFAMELYQAQILGGRWFLHEQGVILTTTDQCMYQ